MARTTGTTYPIMVGLDVPGAETALALSRRLEGIPCWLKVGMELFYAAGPNLVRELKAQGHRIFLDVKLHDIPNTVRGAARSVTGLGVDMFNVHAAGGVAMMRAALEGAEEVSTDGQLPLIIAVTQLTSTTETTLQEEIGIRASMSDIVVRYAMLAKEAGLQGVVSSAKEAAAVKSACEASFLTVTPGIRPAGADIQDQARVMTPAEALRNGADYLVISRPIIQAPDPREALLRIVEEVQTVHPNKV